MLRQVLSSRRVTVVTALVAVSIFASVTQAVAVLVDCGPGAPGNLTSHVSSSSACQYLLPTSLPTTSLPTTNLPTNLPTFGVAATTNPNAFSFFGFNDWVAVPGWLLVDPPSNATGAWNIGALNPGFKYMIVFRDAKGTNLVSFLINSASGTWSTPFSGALFNPTGKSPLEVAHFSVFYHPASPKSSVPEPGTLVLLGLVLAGAVLVRRLLR